MLRETVRGNASKHWSFQDVMLTTTMLPPQARTAFHLLEQFERPWFVAGGWALDLFLGRITRDFLQERRAECLQSPILRAFI